MDFLQALGGVGSLLFIAAVGYLLAWKGWFPAEAQMLLVKLVTFVSLPPYLFYTVAHSFPRDNLQHLLYGTLLPFSALFLTFGLAVLVGKIIKVDRNHFGLFCAAVSNPNTIFIGIPVNVALFGEQALPYVLLYYFAATTFFWAVGNYAISHDGDRGKHAKLLTTLRQIFSPPLLGFLCGMAFVLTQTRAPAFVLDVARYLGSMTTPLALIYIGVTVRSMGLGKIAVSRDLVLALVGRMVFSPLVMLALIPFFPVPPLMAKVFALQSSLPVLMQVAILSAYYRTDPEYGALLVSLSTLLSVLTIPLWMLLI